MALASRSCSSMPASKAGAKSASLICRKSGSCRGNTLGDANGPPADACGLTGMSAANVADIHMSRPKKQNGSFDIMTVDLCNLIAQMIRQHLVVRFGGG